MPYRQRGQARGQAGPGSPGHRLGQARGGGRRPHPAPRPGRAARRGPAAGRRRVHRAALHQRRPHPGPASRAGRLPGRPGRRDRHGQRRRPRHGAGLRRGPHRLGHHPGGRPGADGHRDAAGGNGRARCPDRGAHPAPLARPRVQPGGRAAGAAVVTARMPRVLTIAGMDSGGAAGVAADLKAFARCGAHGLAAVVALTAQNTLEVRDIHEVPADFVRAQIETVLDDIGADAAKTGMLFSAELIEAVAEALGPRALPLVVDPVMLASSGGRLLRPDAVGTLVGRLFPLATVVTPNLPEAQALTAMMTEDRAALAERLVAMGARAALVTGGPGAEPVDHLFDGSRHMAITVARHGVAATHGAGCTHSAALAAGLGAGLPLAEAARQAAVIAGEAVEHGLSWLGGGEGPVHVLHEYSAMTVPATMGRPRDERQFQR